MIDFTLYTADCAGNEQNCVYPNAVRVTDKDSLLAAVRKDHVCALYKNSYRSKDNFLKSNVLPMDCDNDHSDDSKDWITSVDIALAFPDVAFVVVYSRHHMKWKDGKPPRPRFHVYFLITEISDADAYTALKTSIREMFPYFDDSALDSARFFFGTDNAAVEFFDGGLTVANFLNADAFADWDAGQDAIPQGQRNKTMSHTKGMPCSRKATQ